MFRWRNLRFCYYDRMKLATASLVGPDAFKQILTFLRSSYVVILSDCCLPRHLFASLCGLQREKEYSHCSFLPGKDYCLRDN